MAFVPFAGLIGVTGRTDRCRRNLAKPRDEIDDIWSQLAEQMQTQGGTPDTDEWNNIIALAVAGGDLERAEYFLELMKKTGGTPNLASYNLIFSACQEPRASKEKEVVYRLISQAVDDQMDLDELQMSSTLRSTVRSLLEGPQE